MPASRLSATHACQRVLSAAASKAFACFSVKLSDGLPLRPRRVKQAGSRAVGPPQEEAIGQATGTATAARLVTARLGLVKMPPDLGFKVCAPTATRTRDLLLRRHFRSVPGGCWAWPDVPFSQYRQGLDVARWSPEPGVVGSQFGSQKSR
jgi:hypothetical protein